MSLLKRPSFAKSFATHLTPLRKFSQLRNQVWHTSATSQNRSPHFEAANGCEATKRENTRFRSQSSILQVEFQKDFKRRNTIAASVHLLPEPDDARTSGPPLPAKSRHSDMARTRGANLPLLPAANEFRKRAVPSSLTRALSSAISGAVSGAASTASGAHHHFLTPNSIWVAPEVIIRRPMLTQLPIEGNLDCRARPFHSECALTQPPSN
ncbi:hypothetical protein CK203_037215 [Vitis vinifera]|uniref:Uncharacterized protein n=1 Tax=Vitis vinifera TaxID=29760 RepID=A0A438HS37_VITVI|nr:hypothetical protein CK203_037215 [Vitis vinifera]